MPRGTTKQLTATLMGIVDHDHTGLPSHGSWTSAARIAESGAEWTAHRTSVATTECALMAPLGSKSISIRFSPLITPSITSLAGSPTRLSAR
jgi:hypothetical protein